MTGKLFIIYNRTIIDNMTTTINVAYKLL